ncbi:GtrA family protein [Patescibacteria group bacterium]|nr:MAG: GtrA family protein [Patescibacteria group bacterium]
MNLRRIFENKFIRFLAVGGINTIFGYGVFALMIFFGLHYALAALLATILGVLFNFQTVGRLVFASYRRDLLFKFVGVYAFTYLINLVFLCFLNLKGVSNYVSGAILILPMAFIAFYLNKRFVYERRIEE